MADRVALLKLEIQGIKEVDELKDKLKSLKKGTDDYNSTLKQLNTTESQLSKTRNKLIKSTNDLIGNNKKGLTGVSNATGAATASALELGRVFSDAPYGIRGMANNISQLASQFSFMSNKVDAATGKVVGISGAFKQFGQAIKANAALLIIQALIGAVDYFSNRVDKAEKKLNSFSNSVSSGLVKVAEIESLNEAMSSSNSTIEEQEEALRRLKKLGFDPANEGISDFIENQKKLVVVNASIKAAEEQLKEIYTERLKLIGKFKEEFATLLRIQEDGYGGENIQRAVLEQIKLDKKELDKKEKELKDELTKLIKNSLALDFGEGKGSGRKFSPFKSKRDLDIDIKTNEDALLQYQNKIESQELKNAERLELIEANTEKEKEEIRRKYTSRRLENDIKYEEEKIKLSKKTELANIKEKTKNHIASLEMAYKEFVVKLDYQKKLGKINKQQYDKSLQDASLKLGNAVMNADDEETKSIKEVETKYKGLFKVFYELAEERRDALGIGKSKDSEAASLEQYLDQVKQLMGSIGNFISAEYDRQLTIESNHTAKLNEELNNRLLNENLSANERKKIQNQIAINDENLRKKQNAIKKKQFNTNKAFNISTALIDTYLAASKAFKTYGGFPTGAVPMALSIAKGLANVAMIARQKFQPEAASTPTRVSGGGGGGGGSDRSFNFNLVGNTVGNQITDAIQGQFDKPLKAYVVSRDVTNQQALDANIKGAASF